MGIPGLIFLVVALLLIGVGFALGLVAVALCAAMAGLGVISSSVAFGIFRRSPSDALLAMIYQFAVLGGIPGGMVVAWVVSEWLRSASSLLPTLLMGAFAGALSGYLLAWILSWILRWTSTAVGERLKALKSDGL